MAILKDTKQPIVITPGSDFEIVITRFAGTHLLALLGGATGGTFKLTWLGAKSGEIAYNASASVMQDALEGVKSIGPGNIVVTSPSTSVWELAPQGQLAADDFLENLFTIDVTGLTGGSNNRLDDSLPIRDVSALHYIMQARDTPNSVDADIWINDTGAANPGTGIVQGEIDLTDGADGIIKLHVNHTATAALDFANNRQTGIAHWVLMEIDGTEQIPLVEDGQFRLGEAWFV